MRSDNVWASMMEADRQRWLARTERQIVESKARLARCRHEGLSTNSAEIELDALAQRKRDLLKGSVGLSVTASTSTAQKSASARSDSDAQRQRFWQAEYNTWVKEVIEEAKEREKRDAWLRNVQWVRLLNCVSLEVVCLQYSLFSYRGRIKITV